MSSLEWRTDTGIVLRGPFGALSYWAGVAGAAGTLTGDQKGVHAPPLSPRRAGTLRQQR